MSKHFEDDFSYGPGPKAVKGGVFAAADNQLIINALNYYLRQDLGNKEVAQIDNLLHRIRNRV